MIGKRIKELRDLNKVTQEQLANYLGVAPQTVYKYEKEINEPDLTSTSKIANYFGVSLDYLLGRTEKTNTVKEIDKKLSDNDIHIAANSKVDLGKLAKLDDKQAKIINNLIDDFLEDD